MDDVRRREDTLDGARICDEALDPSEVDERLRQNSRAPRRLLPALWGSQSERSQRPHLASRG